MDPVQDEAKGHERLASSSTPREAQETNKNLGVIARFVSELDIFSKRRKSRRESKADCTHEGHERRTSEASDGTAAVMGLAAGKADRRAMRRRKSYIFHTHLIRTGLFIGEGMLNASELYQISVSRDARIKFGEIRVYVRSKELNASFPVQKYHRSLYLVLEYGAEVYQCPEIEILSEGSELIFKAFPEICIGEPFQLNIHINMTVLKIKKAKQNPAEIQKLVVQLKNKSKDLQQLGAKGIIHRTVGTISITNQDIMDLDGSGNLKVNLQNKDALLEDYVLVEPTYKFKKALATHFGYINVRLPGDPPSDWHYLYCEFLDGTLYFWEDEIDKKYNIMPTAVLDLGDCASVIEDFTSKAIFTAGSDDHPNNNYDYKIVLHLKEGYACCEFNLVSLNDCQSWYSILKRAVRG